MANEIRHQVLNFSLRLEEYVNSILARALGITDVEKSHSFNYRGQALSFHQKVNLLLDINLIDKNEHWKFQTFMEIRNKFMHVLAIDSYEKCFQYVNGRNKIIDTYKERLRPGLTKEEELHACCFCLYVEVIHLIAESFKKLLGKVVEDVERQIAAASAAAHREMFDVIFSSDLKDINVDAYWAEFTKKFDARIAALNISDEYTYSPFSPTKKQVTISIKYDSEVNDDGNT